jgi:hypothetical protein
MRKAGKPKDFVDALLLPRDYEKLLRIIFAETDPATAVSLMESILGCPIWVNAGQFEIAMPAGRDYLENYLEQKKRQKVKNQTRLVLCDEKDLHFIAHPTHPIVHRVCGNIFSPSNNPQEIWDFDNDGKLYRLFEVNIPGHLGVHQAAVSRGYGVTTLHYDNGNETRRYFFSDDGTLVDCIDMMLPEFKSFWLNAAIIDDSHIVSKEICYNFREHRFEQVSEFPQFPQSLFERYREAAVLPNVGPVFQINSSMIEVADENLKIISRHKTKGWIREYVLRDDRLFLMTYSQDKSEVKWVNGELVFKMIKPCKIFIYELLHI